MPQNISKYVQINDFLLLEYEFNRDGTMIDLSSIGSTVATTIFGTKQYFNNSSSALGITNNILELNSTPSNSLRSTWFNNYNNISQFNDFFDSSILISTTDYPHDTIKLHVISGYNFDDIVGFLLQVRAQDSSLNMVDLTNFSYQKQDETRGGDVTKFSLNALFLGNRFYDKYIEFKIPSIYTLGSDLVTNLGQTLNIKPLSDVYITYSTVPVIQSNSITADNTYTLVEEVDLQLPVTSTADRFNAFIAQSTTGDFIEYYATFDDQIIGQYMGDIESGRIPLYTSNNPNDNYQEFSDLYGAEAAKWVLIHELYVYEHFGSSSILTQKFSFTQEDNFNSANYFRPVLKNSDIDSSFTIQYICRLSNRMDGSQIIRRASFSSTDPKKYGLRFTRINVDNIIPYKVFNRLEAEQANIIQGNLKPQTKYVKVFYDTTTVVYNQNNEVYPQGLGPILLKNGDSVYKFKFEKINEDNSNQRENVDLSGAYNYGLLFVLDDDTKIEVGPTYSTNMNTTIGELEFKLNKTQIDTLLKQKKKAYSIIVKNPDGTSYNFYEGKYYSYEKREQEKSETQNFIQQIGNLNKQLTSSKSQYKALVTRYNKIASELSTSKKASKTQQVGMTDGNKDSQQERQQDRTAGAEVGIAAPSKVIERPSKEVEELTRRIRTLEKDNVDLTKENARITKPAPSSDPPPPRYPSKERPRKPDGPNAISAL